MANVAFDLVNRTSQNLTSFTATPDNSDNNGASGGSPFDVFGTTDRTVKNDFSDDSAETFPADNFGIVGTGDTAPFFGIEDLDNNNNPGGKCPLVCLAILFKYGHGAMVTLLD